MTPNRIARGHAKWTAWVLATASLVSAASTGCALTADDPGEVSLQASAKKQTRPSPGASDAAAYPAGDSAVVTEDDEAPGSSEASDAGGSFPPIDAAPAGLTAGPPELLSLSPASAPQNNRDVLLTVAGKNFASTALLTFRGEPLQTVFDSSTALRATLPASKLTAPGLYPVLVAGPNGENTAAIMFTLTLSDQPVTVSSASPSSAVEGTGPVAVTLSGVGFAGTPTVKLNGNALTDVRVVSSSTLTASIPSAALVAPGKYPITVSLTPTGAPSVPIDFTIDSRPAPEMTNIRETATNAPVTTATQNRTDLAVTCNGARFVPGSKLVAVSPQNPDGVELTTTVTSDSVIKATIPAAHFKKTGVVELRAFVPSGANKKIFAPSSQWWSITVAAAQVTNGGGGTVTPPTVVTGGTSTPMIAQIAVAAADVPPPCPGWPCVYRGRMATAVGSGFVSVSKVFLVTPTAYWQVPAQPLDAQRVKFTVPAGIPSAVYQVVVCNSGSTQCAGSPRLLGAW